jgi:hypothetical protein
VILPSFKEVLVKARHLSLPFAALLFAACSSQGTPTTTPGPETTAGAPGSTSGTDAANPGTTAQGSQAGVNKPNSSDSTGRQEVLDHTYSLPGGESARLFLAGGATYRAEINTTGIRLELRPLDQSLQAPLVEEFLAGTGAGGTTVFTIRPRQDGEYEIRSIGGDPTSSVSVRVTKQPSNH